MNGLTRSTILALLRLNVHRYKYRALPLFHHRNRGTSPDHVALSSHIEEETKSIIRFLTITPMLCVFHEPRKIHTARGPLHTVYQAAAAWTYLNEG